MILAWGLTGESLTRSLGLSRLCPFPGPHGTFVFTYFVLVQSSGPGIFNCFSDLDIILTLTDLVFTPTPWNSLLPKL